MAYVFDGAAKRVYLPLGMVTLDLIDLWSSYKMWLLAGNAGHPLAFDTVGGDIASIPLYLFIKNGWKTVPQAANHSLVVVGGVYVADDNSDPFTDPAGAFRIRINREAPGIAIGYSSSGGSSSPTASDIAAAVWSHTQ